MVAIHLQALVTVANQRRWHNDNNESPLSRRRHGNDKHLQTSDVGTRTAHGRDGDLVVTCKALFSSAWSKTKRLMKRVAREVQ